MNFSHSDFENSETKIKLTCIIMDDIFNDPMKAYNALTTHEKTKFNKAMNIYIQNELGGADWRETLTRHFNSVINSVFEKKDYDPSKYHVPTNHEAELLLTEEQKEFLETQKMEK